MIIQEAIQPTMRIFADTEYLFGGTSIKREAGKDLSIDCALEVTEGTAKGILDFWS